MKKSVLKASIPDTVRVPAVDWNPNIRYHVHADRISAAGQEILRIVFYLQSGTPYLTVFCSDEDFISWSHKESRWSEAMLDKFDVVGYDWVKKEDRYHEVRYPRYTYDCPESMQAGSLFFDGADDTVTETLAFEQRLRDAKTDKRHKAELDKIDGIMKQARPLPSHFQQWADRHILPQYLYYRRKGKTARGYCTACGTDVILPAEKARHNQPVICPACHRKIICKAVGMARHITDEVRIEYVQRISGGRLMVREIDLMKHYDDHYRKPSFSQFEGSRHIIWPDGNREKYIPNRGSIHWLGEWKPFSRSYEYYAHLYTPGLSAVLRGTPWQYCAISQYAKHQRKFAAAFYLADSKKHPCVEYLCKMGFYRLLNERQGITLLGSSAAVNWNGKSPREVLGIRKDLLLPAARMNVSSEQLKICQLMTEANLPGDSKTFAWLSKHDMLWRKENLIYLLRHMTLWKIQKYSAKMVELSKDLDVTDVISDWSDYLRNAELLGYNLHKNATLFPKDFKKAHDKAANLVKVKKDTVVDKKLRQLCKELSSLYGFRYGDYIVRAPSCLKDLLVEGERQKNCVATYAESVAEQETVVLFIRRADKPDDPFVTVEVQGGHVVQVRGFENSRPDQNVLDFVEAWKKQVLERAERKSA